MARLSGRRGPPIEHPHPECPDCRFFFPGRLSRKCRDCGAGEHFEELLEELDPEHDAHMPAFNLTRYDDE